MKKTTLGISLLTLLLTVSACGDKSPFSKKRKTVTDIPIDSKGTTINEDIGRVASDDIGNIKNVVPTKWFNLDPVFDKIEGVSSDRAYKEFSLVLDKKPVIVAVVDSGVDVNHEDLKGKIWVNSKEIPNNGIDDDGNGFIDDMHGWNFLGSNKGNIDKENVEETRLLRKFEERLSTGEAFNSDEQKLYEEVKKVVSESHKDASDFVAEGQRDKVDYQKFAEVLRVKVGVVVIDMLTLQRIDSQDEAVIEARDFLISFLQKYRSLERADRLIAYYQDQRDFYYNVNFNPRAEIVGDDTEDFSDSNYGNPDVIGNVDGADHGTHVAGIIAAIRDNELGMEGVATNVEIMALRVVPNGDERDKDIYNAIKYAVDNGAKIINMSFGKKYSPNKKEIDEIFQYAQSKGVLMVHSAGNDGINLDTTKQGHFPNPIVKAGAGVLRETPKINSWLEVGASAALSGLDMVANFSNYGKTMVDLFAPGHNILSTIPENKYASFSGTSMASPVVSGVAALLWSQRPTLSSIEVKNLLMASVRTHGELIVNQPTEESEVVQVPFKDLSITGGVVNAFNAFKQTRPIE